MRAGLFPKGKTKGTPPLWAVPFVEKTFHCSYQWMHLLKKSLEKKKILGKIHILKAFDYPEFKMGSCSVAKIQIHPQKNGFCGEKAHDDFERSIYKADKWGPKTELEFHRWRLPSVYLKNFDMTCWRPSRTGLRTVSSTISSRFYSLLTELCAVKHFQKTVKM